MEVLVFLSFMDYSGMSNLRFQVSSILGDILAGIKTPVLIHKGFFDFRCVSLLFGWLNGLPTFR